MKSDKERFPGLSEALESAVIDRLLEQARKGGQVERTKAKGKDGEEVEVETPIYIPSTASLRDAMYGAMEEIVASEVDPIGPMLAIALWDDAVHMNESAFRQKMDRRAKIGTLPFKVGANPRAPKSIAANYLK